MVATAESGDTFSVEIHFVIYLQLEPLTRDGSAAFGDDVERANCRTEENLYSLAIALTLLGYFAPQSRFSAGGYCSTSFRCLLFLLLRNRRQAVDVVEEACQIYQPNALG